MNISLNRPKFATTSLKKLYYIQLNIFVSIWTMSKLNTMSFTCTVYVRSLYLYINKVFFIHCPTLILTLNVAAFIAWWELFILCKWFSIIRSVSCIVGNTDYILFKWTDNFWCCIVLWGSCSSICNIPSGALWAVGGLIDFYFF